MIFIAAGVIKFYRHQFILTIIAKMYT